MTDYIPGTKLIKKTGKTTHTWFIELGGEYQTYFCATVYLRNGSVYNSESFMQMSQREMNNRAAEKLARGYSYE
jgi:hypothetical protein